MKSKARQKDAKLLDEEVKEERICEKKSLNFKELKTR